MEKDLGMDLQWVAVVHFNTGHPHVHIALRGQTQLGSLHLDRNYIKGGIRQHAEDLCTAQLGFRTELDALEAERREVDALRITSLDRRIAREAFGENGDGTFTLYSLPSPISEAHRARQQFLLARLRTLTVMGLTEAVDHDRWRIDPAFLSTLRGMQVAQDRLKTMASGGRVEHHNTGGRRSELPKPVRPSEPNQLTR
jgi:hypothetical protein